MGISRKKSQDTYVSHDYGRLTRSQDLEKKVKNLKYVSQDLEIINAKSGEKSEDFDTRISKS